MPGGAGNVLRNLTALGAAAPSSRWSETMWRIGADRSGRRHANVERGCWCKAGESHAEDPVHRQGHQMFARTGADRSDPSSAGRADAADRDRRDGRDIGDRFVGLRKGVLAAMCRRNCSRRRESGGS